MGGGTYSTIRRNITATAMGYDTKSASEIFTQRAMNNAMSPFDVGIRESRDSVEHPDSVAIIIALDVTGSMGSIPHFLVKNGLPHIMEKIISAGIKDPQVLFLGIGDHECDQAPLQVGQFESSDELLDKWLTTLFLEGRGGGNDGESYHLAWYFAGKHTSTDCFEKRKKKGILFTIGDEKCLPAVPSRAMQEIMGKKHQYDLNTKADVLLDKARETYDVYHLHMKQGSNGIREDVINEWKQRMGNNLILIDKREDVASVIADKVINTCSQKTEDTQKGKAAVENIL